MLRTSSSLAHACVSEPARRDQGAPLATCSRSQGDQTPARSDADGAALGVVRFRLFVLGCNSALWTYSSKYHASRHIPGVELTVEAIPLYYIDKIGRRGLEGKNSQRRTKKWCTISMAQLMTSPFIQSKQRDKERKTWTYTVFARRALSIGQRCHTHRAIHVYNDLGN